MRRFLLVLLAAAPALFAEAPAAEPVKVERVLDRVYLVRDRPGSQTHFQMIVNAGCSDEAGGDCRGLAHYLEHLILVGRNPEHRSAAVRMFPGAYSNGWTNDVATAYVHSLPPRPTGPEADLETLFGFYAARLRDFAIEPSEADRERRVVRQEHDLRVASQPFALAARDLHRQLLPDHPSGQWTIGTAEAIDGFTLDDAKAYHRIWYHLNNAHFVIRADIAPERLKAIAEKAFGSLRPATLPPRFRLRAPEVQPGRSDVVKQAKTVQRAGVQVLKAVRIEERNVAALQAARQVIASYLSSRLPGSAYDVLGEAAKLTNRPLSVGLRRAAPGVYVIALGADIAPGVAPEPLREAMVGYLDRLAARGIDAATLARLKTRFADARETADADPAQVQQRLVSWLAGRNRFEDLAAWPDRVAAVSEADVAAVLAALAGPGRIVTGILAPEAGQ